MLLKYIQITLTKRVFFFLIRVSENKIPLLNIFKDYKNKIGYNDQKLEPYIDKAIGYYSQCVFRKGCSTTDQILCLRLIL